MIKIRNTSDKCPGCGNAQSVEVEVVRPYEVSGNVSHLCRQCWGELFKALLQVAFPAALVPPAKKHKFRKGDWVWIKRGLTRVCGTGTQEDTKNCFMRIYHADGHCLQGVMPLVHQDCSERALDLDTCDVRPCDKKLLATAMEHCASTRGWPRHYWNNKGLEIKTKGKKNAS